MCELYFLFFFKQKTAYEMRISDWSSDVCSSDLPLSRLLLLEVVIDSDQAKSFTQHCISFQEAIQGANYWRKTLMMERAMWSSCTTTRPKATTVFKVDGRIRRFAQCCRRTVFRSEEHTSELTSIMRISYAVSCLNKKNTPDYTTIHN